MNAEQSILKHIGLAGVLKGYGIYENVITAMEDYAMEHENLNNQETANSDLAAVMPRFSESEIEQMAFDWSSERSVGDAEQDSQCMYDYAQGMRAMQKLLLNKA